MQNKFDYEAMTQKALTEPGVISKCYSLFHDYSIGNQFLAMLQLDTLEPINTYKGWQALGRQVKKGGKAIELLMPVTKKMTNEATGEEETKRFFISRKNWFGISQTEGKSLELPSVPTFNIKDALAKLEIEQVQYRQVNGNCQGYAYPNKKQIAVNPVAENPFKTMLHEIAHCLLHSEAETMNDAIILPRCVKEVEAELTAYLVSVILGMETGLAESRGYIQAWFSRGDEKPRLNKVYGAVNSILNAGKVLD
jgi:antirestriction protein ArdC